MLAFDPPRPKKIKTPMLILGGARDTIFHPDEIKTTARAYGTQAGIIADMAHDMMLEPRWETAAERILAWFRERALP